MTANDSLYVLVMSLFIGASSVYSSAQAQDMFDDTGPVVAPAPPADFGLCTEHMNIIKPELRSKPPEDIIRDCTPYLNYMESRAPAQGTFQQSNRDTYLRTAYFERGKAYLLTRQNDKAIADFTAAIKHYNTSIRVYFLRGYANQRNGYRDAAISDYRKCLTFDVSDETFETINQAKEALTLITGETFPPTVRPGPPPKPQLSSKQIEEMTQALSNANMDLRQRLIPDMQALARSGKSQAGLATLRKADAYLRQIKEHLRMYSTDVPPELQRIPTGFNETYREAQKLTVQVARKYIFSVSF